MTLQSPKSSFWLPDDEWRKVQKYLPITCVDVLPFRLDKGEIAELGLILRNTPHQGERWCLIGGRLQYNEVLTEGVDREIIEALGDKTITTLVGGGEPLKVVQYMPEMGRGEYFDPRQHAIGLTYAVELSGIVVPQGEALDFKWFSVSKIQTLEAIGFGQKQLIIDCLQLLGHPSDFLTV
ncbi:MAG: DUF4916 domain-containing protein [Methylococcaceae bacterium]|jgi:ADP-ribose pyrophosphatase YjhB (NUDIX family)